MNTMFAFCLSMLVVTVLGDHPAKPIWCLSNKDDISTCNASGLNFTCFYSANCADAVFNGKAHVAVVDAKSMVAHANHLEIVLVEKYVGVANFLRYYGVAVVKKNSTLSLKNLKGKKSCHTGAGKNAGWVIPVGYLLNKDIMPYMDNQYKSAADYFGGSCVPGAKIKNSVKAVTDKLCQLCKNPTSCLYTDAYGGYKGAFNCMVDGAGEVAFVKHTTPRDSIESNATKYGVADDYRLLCKDGSKKEITMYTGCNIVRRPASAVVIATKNKGEIAEYREIINKVSVAKLVSAKLLSSDTEELLPYDKGTLNYLGEYYDDVKALNPENKAGSVAVSVVLQILGILSVLLVFQ